MISAESGLPVVDGFKDGVFRDILNPGKIGDGAGDFQDPVIGAGTEFEAGNRLTQKHFACGIQLAVLLKFPAPHAGVAIDPPAAGKAGFLNLSCSDDPLIPF